MVSSTLGSLKVSEQRVTCIQNRSRITLKLDRFQTLEGGSLRIHKKLALPLIVLLCVCGSLIGGQSGLCDPRVVPVNDPDLGYQDRGSVCEGLYISPTAAAVEIIGLTFGEVAYELESVESVLVSSPLQETHQIRVQARGRPLTLHYRMDGEIPQNEDLQWDLLNVVVPIQLRCESVALVGQILGELSPQSKGSDLDS